MVPVSVSRSFYPTSFLSHIETILQENGGWRNQWRCLPGTFRTPSPYLVANQRPGQARWVFEPRKTINIHHLMTHDTEIHTCRPFLASAPQGKRARLREPKASKSLALRWGGSESTRGDRSGFGNEVIPLTHQHGSGKPPDFTGAYCHLLSTSHISKSKDKYID